jgi:hypothetical protein
VHGNARYVFVSLLDLTDVNATADRNADLRDAISHGPGAPDGGGGTVERREHTITYGLHELAAKAGDLTIGEDVMTIEPISPRLVSEASNGFGGLDDVSEEDRSQATISRGCMPGSRQELLDFARRVRVVRPREVVRRGNLDELGVRDMRCQKSAVTGSHEVVARCVKDQRRGLHLREQVPNI